jgi:hypothetical protein
VKELSFVLILVHWWKNLLDGFIVITSMNFILLSLSYLNIIILIFWTFPVTVALFRLDSENNSNSTVPTI